MAWPSFPNNLWEANMTRGAAPRKRRAAPLSA
jgi:hypothetical protein